MSSFLVVWLCCPVVIAEFLNFFEMRLKSGVGDGISERIPVVHMAQTFGKALF